MTDGRKQRLEAFTRLARIGADRGNDVNKLLSEACQLSVEALGLARAVLYRLLPGGELVPVVASGQAPPLESIGGSVSRLEERPLFKQAFDDREIVVVRGSGEDPILPKGSEAGERTVVVAPMWGRETCLGFVAGEDGELDDDHVAEIQAYADLVAAFLEQALEQERLTRLGDLKSHFIALASHELRSPVAVIHGIGVTLNRRREHLELEEMAKLHVVLNEQTEHLAHLVNQLLDLSRLEADAIEIRKTQLTVKPVVEAIVSAVAPEHADQIEVAVPDDLETLIDPDAFDRIVSNLVVNALKYGAPPVTITAEQRDTHFRLAVEDRGSGVGKEFVPRLFERFARGDAAQKGGSGLGLAIRPVVRERPRRRADLRRGRADRRPLRARPAAAAPLGARARAAELRRRGGAGAARTGRGS
jgi:signal transduction histidine kinase